MELRRYGLRVHALEQCQSHHLVARGYTKSPAKLNQYRVGSLREKAHRSQQLVTCR